MPVPLSASFAETFSRSTTMCMLSFPQAVGQYPGLQLQSLWDVPWAAAVASPPSAKAAAASTACSLAAGGRGAGAAARSSGPPAQAAPPQQQPVRQEEPQQEFSTWKHRSHGEVQRVIDYMFFTQQQLVPAKRWRMLTAADIGAGGLPCAAYPSDHVAVMCEFEWV